MEKSTFTKVILIAMSMVTLDGRAQLLDDIKTKDFKKRIQSETITYRMLQNGDSAGYTISTYGINGDIYKYREEVQAVFNESLLREDISSSYNIKKKQMVQTERVIEFAGSESRISANWIEKNKIKVQSGKKDSVINAPDHLERVIGLFMTPGLIHDKEGINGYTQFNLSEVGFREIAIAKTEEVKLSTFQGEKKCSVLKFTGGLANQTFYIDQSTHRVIRIEIPDLDWTYEIISISKKN